MRSLVVLLLAGCGWAPARHVAFGYAAESDSAGTRSAIVAHYLIQQAPTGLRAFPDGGRPRVLFRGVLVYYCDESARTWRPLAKVSEPEVDANLPVIVRDWDRTGFTVGVGLRMPGPRYAMTRVDLDGTAKSLGRRGDSPQRRPPSGEYCRQVRDALERDNEARASRGGTSAPPGVK